MDGNRAMIGPPSHVQYTQNLFQLSIWHIVTHVQLKEGITQTSRTLSMQKCEDYSQTSR